MHNYTATCVSFGLHMTSFFQGRHPQADPRWTGASHGEAHRAREPRKRGARGGAGVMKKSMGS